MARRNPVHFIWMIVVYGGIALSDFSTRAAAPPQKTCAVKFKAIANHSACLTRSPKVKSAGVTENDRELIVAEHNKARGNVHPTSTNMLKLTWDDEIAEIAQRWAENCVIHHDRGPRRFIPGRLTLGQNICMGITDWLTCIKAWFDERSRFIYGKDPRTYGNVRVGHYAQMVYADSHKIGCGEAMCGTRDFRICNYGPTYTRVINHVFKMPYISGKSCATCAGHCKHNLCDCGNLACLNGATFNRQNCTCTCLHPAFHYGASCKINCSAVNEIDNANCDDKRECKTFNNIPNECPNLCGICPGGDGKYLDTTAPTTAAAPAAHIALVYPTCAFVLTYTFNIN